MGICFRRPQLVQGQLLGVNSAVFGPGLVFDGNGLGGKQGQRPGVEQLPPHVQPGPAMDFLKSSRKTPFVTTRGVVRLLNEAGAAEISPPLRLEAMYDPAVGAATPAEPAVTIDTR